MLLGSNKKFKETEIGLIPSDWGIFSLTEVASVIGGGTPKTSEPGYWNGEIPWLSVVDFNNNLKKVYKTEKTITNKGLNNSSTNILSKGALVISARGTVGALTQLGVDMAFNQSCYGLVAKSITNDFLYYLVKNSISDIKNRTHGSVFDTITRETLDNIKFAIPNNSSEQQKIAEILSSLDDKIELNRKINDNLEKIASSLFKRWFVDFEFPNKDGKPYKSSGGKMVDSELGEIPEYWAVNSAIDLLDFIKGVEPGAKQYSDQKLTDYIQFFRVADMYNGTSSGIFIDKELAKNIITNFDEVLITTDGTVGRVAIGLEGSYSGGIRKVVSKRDCFNKSFIYFWLKSHYVQNILQEYASDSTTIAHASGAIYGMKIVFNDKISKEFSICTNSMIENILNNLREIKSLEYVRNFLLPRLMSGKIRTV